MTKQDIAAVRQRWSRARVDKRAFWRQSEIAAYLTDMEWLLEELDRREAAEAKAPKQNGAAAAMNLETLDATVGV